VGKCDKSLWTWCVEATLELHRTVWDLFSQERDPSSARLMRLVLADYVGRVLQPRWGTQLVTQQELLASLSAIGLPSANDDGESLALSGITLAIEALSQLSEAQIKGERNEISNEKEIGVSKERSSFSRVPKCWECPSTSSVSAESDRRVIENCGSVVIFTAYTEDERLAELENEVADMISGRNRIIKSLQDSTFSCINHVKLYIINVFPGDQPSKVSSKSFREVSSTMSSCILSRSAGVELISAIHSVAIDIYDLVSTTVSGIPMKEEAQQGQPAIAINYDVELLHRRAAHAQLERLGLVTANSVEDVTGSLMIFSGNATYPTTRLVWATPVPKGRWNMFPRTRHASTVTPSAVNSRPSVCLSSYLLQGRNVMLEINHVAKSEGLLGNVGAKLIAHTLIAHGGHIYIHANDLGPHKLLDAQEVREKVKLKRTTNARISDFISLIKESTLRMANDADKKVKIPNTNVLCAQPRRQLLRVTRYWPLRSDQTFIYSIPKRFDAFISIIRQPQLSAADVDKCKQVIHQLLALKDSKERLVDGYVATRLLKDTGSRDEQLQVFLFFVQSAGLERSVKIPPSDVLVADRIRCKWQDSSPMNSAVPSTSLTSIAADIRNSSRSDSPLPKKPRKACYLWKPNETLNLYDYLMEKEERQHRSQWVDFVGRVKAGNRPAVLYPNLESSSASAKQD
ncbi:hypothetical protein OSTOST_06836, partial [Ostertagia ostertagi]